MGHKSFVMFFFGYISYISAWISLWECYGFVGEVLDEMVGGWDWLIGGWMGETMGVGLNTDWVC